jgi:phosphoribosylcarboxyaminoimidazole (NCAIR) mutase
MILDQVLERAALLMPPEPSIYTIHATRNDQTIVTHRIIPEVAVAQARTLKAAGWRVCIAGAGGRQFGPAEFDQMLSFSRI